MKKWGQLLAGMAGLATIFLVIKYALDLMGIIPEEKYLEYLALIGFFCFLPVFILLEKIFPRETSDKPFRIAEEEEDMRPKSKYAQNGDDDPWGYDDDRF